MSNNTCLVKILFVYIFLRALKHITELLPLNTILIYILFSAAFGTISSSIKPDLNSNLYFRDRKSISSCLDIGHLLFGPFDPYNIKPNLLMK